MNKSASLAVVEGRRKFVIQKDGETFAPWPNKDGDISPLLSACPPPRRWLAHNRLMMGRAHIVTGIGGSSKTTFIYQMAFGAVLGSVSWGWKIDQVGTALLILTEDTQEDVHQTLSGLAAGLGEDELFLLGNKLKILAMAGEEVRLLSLVGGVLVENHRGAGLFEYCKQFDDLVFIALDPALSLTEGDEMNQAHQRYLGQWVDRLGITTGACVMLVTHATKGSANAEEITSHQSRGGGAITDGVRGEFVMRTMTTKEADKFGITDAGERKSYVQLICTKGNKLPHDAFMPMWLRRGNGGLLMPADLTEKESQDPRLSLTDHRILDVLRELCKVATPTLAEWRSECEKRRLITGSTEDGRVTQMKRAVSRLLNDGQVKRGSGKGIYIPVYDGELE